MRGKWMHRARRNWAHWAGRNRPHRCRVEWKTNWRHSSTTPAQSQKQRQERIARKIDGAESRLIRVRVAVRAVKACRCWRNSQCREVGEPAARDRSRCVDRGRILDVRRDRVVRGNRLLAPFRPCAQRVLRLVGRLLRGQDRCKWQVKPFSNEQRRVVRASRYFRFSLENPQARRIAIDPVDALLGEVHAPLLINERYRSA